MGISPSTPLEPLRRLWAAAMGRAPSFWRCPGSSPPTCPFSPRAVPRRGPLGRSPSPVPLRQRGSPGSAFDLGLPGAWGLHLLQRMIQRCPWKTAEYVPR